MYPNINELISKNHQLENWQFRLDTVVTRHESPDALIGILLRPGSLNHPLQLRKRNAFRGNGEWHSIDAGNGANSGTGFVAARQGLANCILFENEREPHKTEMLVETMKAGLQ